MAKSATLKVVSPVEMPKTIGTLITEMAKIDRERSKLSAEDKRLKEQYDDFERELIPLLKAQQTDKAVYKTITAELKVTPRPKIVDDAALWKYTKKHDYFHLYYRRLNQTSYNELYALNGGKPLPGTEVFEEEHISLRGVKAAETL